MIRTYKAIQITKPGKLNLVELPIREPGPGQVRIRVEACGVCHSDVATVEGQYPGLILPRVPGHEVVGPHRRRWRRRFQLENWAARRSWILRWPGRPM